MQKVQTMTGKGSKAYKRCKLWVQRVQLIADQGAKHAKGANDVG